MLTVQSACTSTWPLRYCLDTSSACKPRLKHKMEWSFTVHGLGVRTAFCFPASTYMAFDSDATR